MILAQIQFLQLLAGLEVTQAADFVQRERADLHVRQVPQGRHVLQVVAPQVQILDLREFVCLAAHQNEVWRKNFNHL